MINKHKTALGAPQSNGITKTNMNMHIVKIMIDSAINALSMVSLPDGSVHAKSHMVFTSIDIFSIASTLQETRGVLK